MKTRHFDRIGNGGITFTELGFGSAPLGNLYRAISDEDANATLEAAWKAGCRYYDTAPLYGLGLSETRLNPFLRGRKRDDYVLSSKVGRIMRVAPPDQRTGIGKFFDTPSRREVYDYSYDGVMRSFEASLERLGVDRIDILFVHDVDIFTHGSKEASDARIEEFMSSGYYGLLSLRDQGVIKAFGGGINEWQVAQTLAQRGDFDLFLLAGRYTLLEQEALESFLPLCQKRGIGIVLGGPYNSGVLATGPKPGAFYNYSEAPKEILDRVARIEAVCKRHGVRLIEAALQFPLQHPSVMSVIPGGQRPAEVESNRALLDTNIPPALWADLKQERLMRADAPTA
ncbi:aldo/keto reductase [Mesorhizobium sp. M2D.F.Ca.ET.185.01.1.1]|uniref:aldo/keto reductase n=1 Tax=unclassified Mesorhizobium TaxID=325217 RepID=UPI000FCAC25D|nr:MULTISPECIES: aldo/keto reductase [unclassified Mesorhizobium]TGP80714.1 aldo/keto reductase [bacterium M00.F.Ca.ET.227.01.1.1]TGP90498.1 aldo/keto reductase [bacterium M00.F.Ca.ET.221.01.1.1]TGP97178.1 aldo/keto reductase [bacterium M00.F.Ca.ET.222.01.1.1]TGT75710.1 aldo/keto reductase [bacterium M00.F.Ca.ET.159.01.1.1]TGT84773.1 aldo/keto reductase [bacterium M00.F.Ca.ET.157.01.1.1]TGU12219.1 aldo/keto reductase [bacterium M00.F.Ca.ET.163.01.1.1]TGU26047.1 aldo/keto reductase [bacterium